MQYLYEKTIKSTSIYQGKVISLQVDEVELPNGKKSKRELVKHPGAVAILPFTEDGKLVLVRQFRKPLEKVIYEIPAGKLEQEESPESCASRELEEETGYISKHLQLLTSFYTSPGFADELIYLYEARQLQIGQVQLDEDEFVEVVHVTLEEGQALLEKEHIHDAKTMYALLYWQNKQLKEKLSLRE